MRHHNGLTPCDPTHPVKTDLPPVRPDRNQSGHQRLTDLRRLKTFEAAHWWGKSFD
jgi:hypothetical protein